MRAVNESGMRPPVHLKILCRKGLFREEFHGGDIEPGIAQIQA
jgi:hypothetical protein